MINSYFLDLPKTYLYLEKWFDINMTLPNAERGHAVPDGDNVFIHLLGRAPGNTCGLTETCDCPLQLAFHINPQLSINLISDAKSQRVFSYNNRDINVHVITNSLSSSQSCR